MVQAAPPWRSAGRTFFDQPGQVLAVAGNGLASYLTIARERYRASRSQPAQPEQDEPAQHHQAQGQQAEQKDVAAKCSHRDISHAGGSEGTVSDRLGMALYPSAQSGNNPRKNGQAAPRLRRCTADAKTAFRCHDLATAGSGTVVSKTPQASNGS